MLPPVPLPLPLLRPPEVSELEEEGYSKSEDRCLKLDSFLKDDDGEPGDLC